MLLLTRASGRPVYPDPGGPQGKIADETLNPALGGFRTHKRYNRDAQNIVISTFDLEKYGFERRSPQGGLQQAPEVWRCFAGFR
jgi:hypothetical protein